MSKYGGKRHFVYLAGAISMDKRTYHWRTVLMDLMKHENIVFLNPCDTLYNKRLYDNGAWDISTVAETQGKNLLKPKDFKMIEKSSIMVLNLDYVTVEKPLIGSVIEFEWAVRWFGIPVIIVCSDPENPYVMHPWIRQYANAIVENIHDVVDILREFFI